MRVILQVMALGLAIAAMGPKDPSGALIIKTPGAAGAKL
jgi:hypothetical protein